MEFFDSHAHYNDERYDEDREIILREIYASGVTNAVCVGYNFKKSELAVKIAQSHDFIYATCGISPNDIEDFSEENLKKMERLAQNKKVVAIGEIGLDYYWNKDNQNLQKEIFIQQIQMANRQNKPIVIHTRDAVMDTIEILKTYPVTKKGIFHCCPLNPELIKEGVKLGFYISFSGNITFKNAKPEKAIAQVPLERLLVETDCPYLTPEPFRGKRNDSTKVKWIVEKIAQLKGMPKEEIARVTYRNAKRIFEI